MLFDGRIWTQGGGAGGRRHEECFSLFATGADITFSFHHGFLAMWLFQSAATHITYS